MATKKNKAKKTSIDKSNKTSWAVQYDIPPEIIQLCRSNNRRTTRGSPLHYVSNICTTKLWVPVPSRCSRSSERQYPQFRLLGNSSNTSSASKPLEYFRYNYMAHNAPSVPDYTDGRRIVVYSSNQRKWIAYDEFNGIDPFDSNKKRMEFTSIIGLIQGKFYALSLQGALAVIERVDSRLTITGISASRAVPSVNWKLFKEQLFQMEDDIFLIFFIHERSIEIVDRVEVFRLCLGELKWIKMERMEGKTVFLDRRCCWVNSAEIGCRGDCVYFSQGKGNDNGWWIYDMSSSCISPASMEI